MSKHELHNVAETAALIKKGRVLLLAGDEELLRQLPEGKWIGGTTANFMAPGGGVTSRDRIFVTDVTEHAESVTLKAYGEEELRAIGGDYPANGFTVIIVPGLSALHGAFAKDVSGYEGVFNSPLFGWISGVHVSEIGQRAPKVFIGNGEPRTDRAAAMHVALPASQTAKIDIINLFSQGDGDEIEFGSDGFGSDGDCAIAGQPANLARYIKASNIDVKLPLVADYNGAQINVSLRDVDAEKGVVSFYAPVFKGVKYRFARPVPDYLSAFGERLGSAKSDHVSLSCNCILNYLYSDLEGKETGEIVGPVTFGEVAYMLLNQTLAYVSIGPAH